MLIQIETVCAKNTERANILRSPWVFTIHEARLMTLHRPMYCNPYANLLEVTLLLFLRFASQYPIDPL